MNLIYKMSGSFNTQFRMIEYGYDEPSMIPPPGIRDHRRFHDVCLFPVLNERA